MSQRGSMVRKTDKTGRVWEIERTDYPDAVLWDARTASVSGRYTASVTVTDSSGAFRPMAFLDDMHVEPRMENRGVGSLLLAEVIATCRERGHDGIEGELSIVDQDNFDKLTYIYEKFGFTVTFCPPEHPRYDPWRPGKIRLEF